MRCKYCKGNCVKAGKQSNGTQKYICKGCSKYQQMQYVYKAYEEKKGEMLIRCLKAGCGIRGTGRILEISCTTIISKIREFASFLESGYSGVIGKRTRWMSCIPMLVVSINHAG